MRASKAGPRQVPALAEPGPASATEWMQLSIVRQSEFNLRGALEAARKATEISQGSASRKCAWANWSLAQAAAIRPARR